MTFSAVGFVSSRTCAGKNNKHESAYLIERATDEGLICLQPEESFRILMIWRSFPG